MSLHIVPYNYECQDGEFKVVEVDITVHISEGDSDFLMIEDDVKVIWKDVEFCGPWEPNFSDFERAHILWGDLIATGDAGYKFKRFGKLYYNLQEENDWDDRNKRYTTLKYSATCIVLEED